MLKLHKATRSRSLIRAVLAGTSLCMVMIPAHAASSDPAPAEGKGLEVKSFMDLDSNRDGVIDRKEALASPALAKSFDSVDANNDGRISVEEYAKGAAPK